MMIMIMLIVELRVTLLMMIFILKKMMISMVQEERRETVEVKVKKVKPILIMVVHYMISLTI